MSAPATRRILVVEDDRKIAELLLAYLRADGHDTFAIADGREALRCIEQETPALLILDWMLPSMDGLAVCQAVREFSDLPILMLTARVDEIDRLAGLDTGADDYVCKPFAPREVVARVRALLRRAEGKLKTAFQPWHVDDVSFRISWRGQWLTLTRLEFLMLRLLLSRPGRVFSRSQLLSMLHDTQPNSSDRAIDTHVKNIRKKIETIDPGCEYIASVYGIGYRFDVLG